MLQIDRDALLVAIQVDEVRRLVAVERRTPCARDLALERLDLDHLRPVIAQHRRGERSGERVREIQDRDVVECERHAGVVSCGDQFYREASVGRVSLSTTAYSTDGERGLDR